MGNCRMVGGKRQLVNPDINPRVISLTVTSASGKTSAYFADACGLAAAFSKIDATNGVAMTPVGLLTAAALKAFIQTYALVVDKFNFTSALAAGLANQMTTINVSLEGATNVEVLASANDVSNLQNNANLLTVMKPFVWTTTTSLNISMASGTDTIYTFVFTIRTMVPYGDLDNYLEENPVFVS